MWKKIGVRIGITILTLLSVFSVVYTMDHEMQAAEGNYYGPEDILPSAMTGEDPRNDFQWRGAYWKIGYTNQDTGRSLIYLNARASNINDSTKADITYWLNDTQNYHTAYYGKYWSPFGNLVEKQGAYLGTLKQMSLSQYSQFSNIPNLNTWLADTDKAYSSTYPLQYKSNGCDGKNYIDYPGYPNVCYVAKDFESPVAGVIVAFEINAIPKTLVLKPTPPEEGYTYRKNIKKLTETGSIFATTESLVPITLSMPKGTTGTDANNFEIIDSTEKVVTETTGTKEYKFRVKENAPDLDEDGFLYAGTYKVCVNAKVVATDATDSQSCGEIIVDKASPKVKFEKPEITKVKLEDEITESIITDMDPLKLSGNLSASYSLSEDTAGTGIKVENDASDATKFVIFGGSNKNANLPATYTLTVTVPKNDIDNYNTATATKDILVYKGLEKLTWTPTKSVFEKADVTSGSSVGTLLAVDGLADFTYDLTSPADGGNYHASAAADNASFHVVSTSLGKGESASVTTTENLEERAYHVQFKVTDAAGDSKYVDVVIQVGKKVQPKLEFKENNQTITTKTIYYDDTTQSVRAVGGENTLTNDPTYALSDPADSTYLTVSDDGKLSPNAITGDGKTVKVKATKKGNAVYADVSAEIEITILPAKQTISFTDATDPKRIKLKTVGVVQDAKGILTSDGSPDSGVGGITYTSSDESVFTVDDKGNITTVGEGTATLSATLNASDKADYDKNYETATCKKTITVYKDMKFTWEPAKATANKINVSDTAGTILVEGNTGKVTFSIKEGEEIFKFLNPDVNPGTLQWNKAITADDIKTSNEFKITIIATDDNGPQEYEVTITVGKAENDFYYVKPSDGKTKITELTETYSKGKTIQLLTHTSNGASVSYKLKDGEDDSIFTVNNTGKVSILKTGGPVIVEASVPEKDGYAAKTIELPITITKNAYDSIAFDDPNTTNVAYSNLVTSEQPATLLPEGEIAYEVEDSTKDICTIDENGKVTALKAGTCKIKATSTDKNYEEKSTSKEVIFYDGATVSFIQTNTPQAVNPDKTGDTGNAKEEAAFGPVSVAGGINKPYNIQIKNDDYANLYFEFAPIADNQRASTLKLKSGKSITADILKEGITKGVIQQDITNKDQYNWKIKVLPDTDTEPQEITVHIIGADPILTFEKEVDGKLTTIFEEDGTIDLSVKRGESVMDSGISVEGTTGYSTYIKNVSSFTTDAQLNGTGIVKANCDDDDNVLAGKDFKLTPKAEASDGYKSGTGTPTPVIIKKADHPDVDFEDPDITLSSYIQSVDKGFTGILTDDEHLEITPQGETTWTGTSFTKEDKGDTGEPSVTITPNGFEGTITYVVNGGGTVNYKPIENKEIHLAFAQEGGISYKPIKITYGDDTKKVIDYISDADKEKNTYIYAPVDGSKYINDAGEELFTLNGESTITTLQVGKTKVNVTRTDEKGNVITQAIPVEIVKKEITLTYESNTIYTGEALPTPVFKEPDAGVLVGSDTIADFPIPTSAAHYDGTEVLIDSETAGTYDTKGNWTNDELATDVNPNYKVTIKAGKLTIKKDTVKDNWYHLENPEGNTVSKTSWHNYRVDVVLDTATGSAGTYDQVSNTKTFTDTNKTRFTVTNEDENTEDVYFRIDPDSEAEHKGAITSTQTTVKIDMTKPNITKVTGYPVNTDGLSELINNLTFGMFFKPGVDVTIETEDPQPSGETGRVVSGVNTVSYKIYKLGEKGEFDSTQTPKTGEGKVDANEKISFKINDVGNYRICAIAKDNATNTGNESCSDVNVKKVNVDIDGDGTNDFVDTDENGCPDLNIILGEDTAGNPEDKDGNPVKLNVAEKNKNYPYMNIDANGDGKADLNIDTDHDGKPDLNLVIMNEALWKPKQCVVVDKLKDYSEPIEYCTGTDAKAVINVDTTGDRIPDINIDTKGDFKADYNVDTNGDKEPDLNIGKKHTTWIPDHDYRVDGFIYDSIGEHKPLINIDTNGDGKPDINIDLNGDGSADINIDTTGNGIPNINIDGDGDGIPDYNLDTNEDGNPTKNVIILDEWKPDANGKYQNKEFDTMHIEGKTEVSDSGIVIEKSDGKFLPNTAIKVNDISSQLDDKVKSEIDKVAKDKEVKTVYDVDYIESNTSKQPDGKVIVKIPVDESLKNPSILVEKEDGSFEEVKAKEKDGYYVFETDYIGKVCVMDDKEDTTNPTPNPDPSTQEPSKNPSEEPSAGNTENPSTSVKGNYTQGNQAGSQGSANGMGGALTGDETIRNMYLLGLLIPFSILWGAYVVYRRKDISK